MLYSRSVALLVLALLVVCLPACGSDSSGTESATGGSGANSALATGGAVSTDSGGGNSTGGGMSGEECLFELEPPSETLLQDLNQQQLAALCDKRVATMLCSYPESFLCNQEALLTARDSDGEPAETCREVEANCLVEGSESAEEWDECSGDIDFSQCEGTVAQYEQCVRELHEKGRSLIRLWSCDEVDEFFTWRSAQDVSLPDSCAGLEECIY